MNNKINIANIETVVFTADTAEKLKEFKPDEIGIITSPFLTNESAFV